MRDRDVIEDPRGADVALDPVRSRLLAELAEPPASAAAVGARIGLATVNHHLKALEVPGTPAQVWPAFAFAGGEGTGVQLLGHLCSDGAPAFVESGQPSWQQAWLEGAAAEVAAAKATAG